MRTKHLGGAVLLHGILLCCLLGMAPAGQTSDRQSTDANGKTQVDSEASKPRLRTTVLGTKFEVHPDFDRAIAGAVGRVRRRVRTERQRGRFIAFISTPLSPRGGGHRATNVAISKYVKRRLEARYGVTRLWVLASGQVEDELPDVAGRRPGGGEYLFMWTEILAGDDGTGADVDMVYFVGPTDVASFFGVQQTGILDGLDAYVSRRAKVDADFDAEVAQHAERRRQFLRYYGLRASVAFSRGAHDEWNIFRLINRNRPIAEQVAAYFDGRALSPAELQTPVRPGYEAR